MADNETGMTKFNNFMKTSIIVKISLIGILILIMLIPFSMIKKLIEERKNRKNTVIEEISSKWANQQVVNGPIITIPFDVYKIVKYESDKEIKEKIEKETRYAYFLPEEVNINGNIESKVLKRGIYSAVLYSSELSLDGYFLKPDFSDWNVLDKDIHWNNASLIIGFTDMRGIKNNIQLKFNDKDYSFEPGINNKKYFPQGVSAKIEFNKDIGQKYLYNIKLDLKGSKNLEFIPLGKVTNVGLSSEWKTPSFCGEFLPEEREISDKGFNAKWKIFHYNREFPQKWFGDDWYLFKSRFGVELFTSVDEYQKTTRSSKYSILFIFLTFLTFFIFYELLNKKIIHPIQYLFVGFSLCIFYLLLLSISEHIIFNFAYLIVSIMTITIVSIYSYFISRIKSLTVIMFIMLSGLYSFLFIILQVEDYSLLFGSIGLFVILATDMIITRKIDWYNFSLKKNNTKIE